VVTLLVIGCNPQDASDLKHDASHMASTSERALGNAGVVARVNISLSQQKEVDVSGMHIEARNGVVTLGGHVKSDHERRLAEKTVLEIKGVDKVVNNLRIEPISKS
jgi:osmotically-inducible protein OsmY